MESAIAGCGASSRPRPPKPPGRRSPAGARSTPAVALGIIAAGAVAAVGLWWFNTPYVSGLRRLGHQRRPCHRTARRLLRRGARRAHGAAATAGERPRRRPAGALAFDGRPLHGEPDRRPRPADHLGLRDHGPHQCGAPGLDAPAQLSRRAHGHRRRAALRRGRHQLGARRASPQLRYETWYYLHFYTYLAIALAFSHQFADGAEFMRSLGARVFWAALYIARLRRARLVPDPRSARAQLAPPAARRVGRCANRPTPSPCW